MESSTETITGHSLNSNQVDKLRGILSKPVEIHPPNNFPSLIITPEGVVKLVKQRLLKKGIEVRDIRLNGSAASYCLCEDREGMAQIQYNDIDLIFGVSIEYDHDFHVIKEEVVTSLLDFFPDQVTKTSISCQLLEETYVKQMVLISNSQNRWSLISLGDQSNNISIELKFVHNMKRKFEFTVDSFQILLDSYLDCDQCVDRRITSVSQSSLPSVRAVSVYHDFEEAMHHLNNRLIHTEAPEEIRGGGLLKYCSLNVNGFKAADHDTMNRLEPYMCSRFFIDFPTTDIQFEKLLKYVSSRFLHMGEGRKCIDFLDMLYMVVSCRANCLMGSERQKTISVILHVRSMVFIPINIPFLPPPLHPSFISQMNPKYCYNSSLPPVHRYRFESRRSSPPPSSSYNYYPLQRGFVYSKPAPQRHWDTIQPLMQVR